MPPEGRGLSPHPPRVPADLHLRQGTRCSNWSPRPPPPTGSTENALHRSLSRNPHGRSYGDADTVTWALEEGWKLGVRQAAADGTITLEEEVRLRDFRNRLALSSNAADPTAATQLYQASRKRLLPQAQDTALSAGNGNRKLDDLSKAFQDAGLDPESATPTGQGSLGGRGRKHSEQPPPADSG